MPPRSWRTLAIALLFVIGGMRVADANGNVASDWRDAPWENWQTWQLADHRLTGRIWSPSTGQFISPAALAESLGRADFVLIGEVHDNPDHHRLQAWLIGKIAQFRKPAVVMEMISVDQADRLRSYLSEPGADAAELGRVLGWETSGWPAWPTYRPIAEAAIAGGLAIVPGNPARDATRTVAADGLGALTEAPAARLAGDSRLPPELGEALRRDIEESHCDLLPETAIGPMTDVQRFRDAALATALADAGAEDGAILIAGNGHVRADRGVPWYLARLFGAATTSTVMLVEVTDQAAAAADLAEKAPDGRPAADFFWFTPRAERGDPCEELRRRFAR